MCVEQITELKDGKKAHKYIRERETTIITRTNQNVYI